jgi:hypothetical protein
MKNSNKWGVCNICNFKRKQGFFFKIYIFNKSNIFFLFILLFNWGYIVTFAKVLGTCHSWIHPLHHSPFDFIRKENKSSKNEQGFHFKANMDTKNIWKYFTLLLISALVMRSWAITDARLKPGGKSRKQEAVETLKPRWQKLKRSYPSEKQFALHNNPTPEYFTWQALAHSHQDKICSDICRTWRKMESALGSLGGKGCRIECS